MKVLLVSKTEDHICLLHELKKEGQETLLLSVEDTGAWKGMIPRAETPQQALEWGPDLVLFDGPGFARVAEKFEDSGVQTVGGGKFHDRICSDYMFGLEVLDVNKIPTPEVHKFSTVPDALDFLVGKDRPWTYRRGKKHHTTTNPHDMLVFLDLESPSGDFYLQEAYSPGVSGSYLQRPDFWVAGLFNSRGLMSPALYLQEDRNLLPDGMGISTCEGVSLCKVGIDTRLVESTLKPLELTMKSMGYCGWVFLGCIMGDKEVIRPSRRKDTSLVDCYSPVPVVTECGTTPPPGFWAAFLRGLKQPFHLFLDRFASPRSRNTPFEFWDRWLCSRRVTVPPYPITEAPWLKPEARFMLSDQIPECKFRKEEWGIYWGNVEDPGNGFLELTGPTVGFAVGRGDTQLEALRDVGSAVYNLNIPHKQAKLDRDPVCEYDIHMLQSWGFLPDKEG